MQFFVEILASHFENLAEVHLLYHSHRLHQILDEIILDGRIVETAKMNIFSLNLLK